MDFAVPVDHRVNLKEGEKKDKYLNLAREESVEHESDVYTKCNWCSSYDYQRISTRTEGLGNKRDHLNSCITEIG